MSGLNGAAVCIQCAYIANSDPIAAGCSLASGNGCISAHCECSVVYHSGGALKKIASDTAGDDPAVHFKFGIFRNINPSGSGWFTRIINAVGKPTGIHNKLSAACNQNTACFFIDCFTVFDVSGDRACAVPDGACQIVAAVFYGQRTVYHNCGTLILSVYRLAVQIQRHGFTGGDR